MKKKFLYLLLLFVIFSGVVFLSVSFFDSKKQAFEVIREGAQQVLSPTANSQQPTMTVFTSNLEIPWALAFLPDGRLLVTERPGRVRLVETNGTLIQTPVATINEVKHSGEGGLLGIAVHPNFSSNQYVYVYYTYSSSENNTLNRVVRYVFANNELRNPKVIVDAIPGASNHNGGRLKFGPDKLLYITTGDAQAPSRAQDTNPLAGKILRVTDEGAVPSDNPFANPVYSYGHRNPQGLVWSDNTMYATEHGQSAHDELNVIEKGKNYGWPTIEGETAQSGLVTPIKGSGTDTWAPSGTAFYNGSVFFAGLRGQALYEAKLNGASVTLVEHFKSQLGRIREAVVGSDNALYLTTTNRDGRGSPASDDDKLYRVTFDSSF